VIEANVRALAPTPDGRPALARYAEVAAILTGDPAAAVEDGIAWIRDTVGLLEIPRLAAFGLGTQDVDDVAAKAAASSSMQGNPAVLSTEDLRTILLDAI
jgi:alcohol dehydrogenase class IV